MSRSVTARSPHQPLSSSLVAGPVRLFVIGALAITACEPKPTKTCEVTALAVSPPTPEIEVGASVTLTGSLTQTNCNPLPAVTWSSSATNVASVSQEGVVTGVGAGSATITGLAQGKSATATVTVRQAAVATVTITNTNPTVVAGETVQLSATLRDVRGAALSGRALDWRSSNETIVTVVAATGLATGVNPGSATITVTSEGRSSQVAITVTPAPVATVTVAPGTVSLNVNGVRLMTATLRDSRGNTLTRPVTWGSSNDAVASVSTAGLVTAVSPGQAVITATSEGRSGTATVTVAQVAVATVTLVLSSQQLGVGQNTAAVATLRAANGDVITGRTVNFASSNEAIATVTRTGPASASVTAIAGGTATISASIEGVTATQDVTVAAAVASVTLSQTSASLQIGGTVTLVATPRDGQGNALTGRGISWSVQPAAGIATVDQNGLVTAVGAGTATVTATSEGRSASATITVAAPVAVVSVTLSQTAVTLNIGGSVTLVAIPRDGAGNPLSRPVTWQPSSNPGVATVDGTGKVSAIAVGSATITATSEGISASATITVVNVGVASITEFIIPATEGGTSRNITVVPKDAGGNALTNRVCTWVSSLPNVASVTSPGMTTTLTVVASIVVNTQVTITVTCEGVSFAAVFTATPIPVATVIVLHDSTHLAVGEKGLARVELRSAANTVLNGREVRWSVSNMLRATVPPGSGWTFCAIEGGTCSFTGTKQVRYGISGLFFYKEITGGTPCNNGVFGDPNVGFPKQCHIAELVVTSNGNVEVTAVGTGGLTAVTVTATPVVNPLNRSGGAPVQVVPEFRVVTAEAVPNGPPFSIETTNVLTFTNAINLGTFTTSSVFLRVTGGAVVPATSTSNAAPNVYGYDVLQNEGTNYTFNYTAGLRDIYAKSLKNPGSYSYTTVEMDAAYYYGITSHYAFVTGGGLSMSLDAANKCVMVATNTSDTKQQWYTEPDPTAPGYFRIRNRSTGAGQSLEGGNGAQCFMAANSGYTDQIWYTSAAVGLGPPWIWRLHTELLGAAKSLDQVNPTYVPYMADTGAFSGQYFRFTRLSRR